MHNANPLNFIDFYKADHRSQYPNGTTLIYSNFTPRKSRVPNINHMVFFGLQYAVKEYLQRRFNDYFFSRPKDVVVDEYQALMDYTLGPGKVKADHIGELHDLGYLPLAIDALPEGTRVPMGTPALTLWNTNPRFFWLTNYLETLLSCILWKPCTSATTAGEFYKNFRDYAQLTSMKDDFVKFQGHDFSFRGMSQVEDACVSGGAHLLYFVGTDTVPAIGFLEDYYNADKTKELVGCSVPATEHSVMSAGNTEDEFNTYKRLITQIYPDGIVSIVSDTWDFWNVVTNYLPRLKQDIVGRKGKLVIRPDSGTPNLILCGDPNGTSEPEKKGLVRLLGEIFGETRNSKGFLDLHDSVGYIYGDAITLGEQKLILERLRENGYSSTNGVLGIGSYTYQYVTRDTFGTVCKSTYCEVNGQPRDIFKSPKTGSWKKSHRGLLRVNEDLTVDQQVSWDRQGGMLRPVFRDGKLLIDETLSSIRSRVA